MLNTDENFRDFNTSLLRVLIINMKWIIDLLIDKWNRDEKRDEFEPVPLYIEDYIEEERRSDEGEDTENEKKSVIIIDL